MDDYDKQTMEDERRVNTVFNKFREKLELEKLITAINGLKSNT